MPAGRFLVTDHWSAMQSGNTPGRGFEKGFLIKKSTEKCIWEGVPELGFSAGVLIR